MISVRPASPLSRRAEDWRIRAAGQLSVVVRPMTTTELFLPETGHNLFHCLSKRLEACAFAAARMRAGISIGPRYSNRVLTASHVHSVILLFVRPWQFEHRRRKFVIVRKSVGKIRNV